MALIAVSPIDQLGESIAELASRLHAATYELLVLLRRFDDGAGWSNGFRSCAHWLSWRTGIDLGAAREKVRVAQALAVLPAVSAALQRGQVSYAKVRALTRVATPANEAQLLAIAQAATASHVEQVVRAWRRCDRVQAAREAAARHLARSLTSVVDDDGMVVIRARLSPEVGAVVQRALEAAVDRLRAEAAQAAPPGCVEEEVTSAQRRADALGLLAECALAADLDRGHTGDRYQVVLHVEAPNVMSAHKESACRAEPALLAEPALQPGPESPVAPAREPALACHAGPARCTASATHTEPAMHDEPSIHMGSASVPGANDGGHAVLELHDGAVYVSAETSARLTCDASRVVMTHDTAGRVLDVGQKTRTVPTAIRRALLARDRRCQFPGCTARHCDAHHLTHWAHGGATALDNLTLLCRRHHRLVHEGGVQVRRGSDGAVVFHRADGARIEPAPAPPRWRDDRADRTVGADPLAPVVERLAAAGIGIDPRTLQCWDGVPFEVGYVIDVLRGSEPISPLPLERAVV